MASLWFALFPVIGILAFAFAWNHLLALFEAHKPGWLKTPNYLSVALAIGITLFMTQVAGAFLLDPLAMDKIQVSILAGAFDASDTCLELNRTPVFSLSCKQEATTPNGFIGIGRIPYGDPADCKCEWVMK